MITLNTVVDNVFVINLKRRPDRLKEVTTEMQKHNIQFERFSAIDDINLELSGVKMKRGLGCALSHLTIYKFMLQRNYKQIAVFEDDVYFHENFNELFPIIYKEVPNDWDLLYLGGNNYQPAQLISTHIEKTTCTYGFHGYLIKRLACIEFYLANRNKELKGEIDIAINNYIQYYEMRAYICKPKLAFQKPGYSDIRHKEVDYTNDLK